MAPGMQKLKQGLVILSAVMLFASPLAFFGWIERCQAESERQRDAERITGEGLAGEGALSGFSFVPIDCAYGPRQGFHEVDLIGPGRKSRVRLVQDPVAEEWVVNLSAGEGQVIQLRQRSCARLEAGFEALNLGSRKNPRYFGRGYLVLECELPRDKGGPGYLRGKLRFNWCF